MFVSGRFRGFVAYVTILVMLAVAVSPLWHSHEEDTGRGQASTCGHGCNHDQPEQPRKDHQDRGDHSDCAVCVAIHAPVGSGLSSSITVLPVQAWLGMVAAVPGDQPAVRFLPVLWPCGPPAQRA